MTLNQIFLYFSVTKLQTVSPRRYSGYFILNNLSRVIRIREVRSASVSMVRLGIIYFYQITGGNVMLHTDQQPALVLIYSLISEIVQLEKEFWNIHTKWCECQDTEYQQRALIRKLRKENRELRKVNK